MRLSSFVQTQSVLEMEPHKKDACLQIKVEVNQWSRMEKVVICTHGNIAPLFGTI